MHKMHWNFNHFVVLNGFKGNKAVLNDPARGTYTVPIETFDESFTGICLMFEPGEEFVPGGKPQSVFGFAKKRLKGAGAAIAFVTMTTIISSLIGIISPAFSRIFFLACRHRHCIQMVARLCRSGGKRIIQSPSRGYSRFTRSR